MRETIRRLPFHAVNRRHYLVDNQRTDKAKLKGHFFCKTKKIKYMSLTVNKSEDGPVLLTWLPDKFESTSLSVHKKKFNIDFKMAAILDFQSEWF